MKNKKYFIFDFDSTFIKVEALEELAVISLKGAPNKESILAEIKEITEQGIEGKLLFSESLRKRIRLINANKEHLEPLLKRLKSKISVSIKRNKEFFKRYSNDIYIVSGGFKEFINPIAKQYHILEHNIFSNTFLFDSRDNIVGFDELNVLSQENGKVKLLKSLHLSGDVYVIGDGYTDYQMREAGFANKFYAFTENIQRESVIDKSDNVAPSFDEFLYLNKLPMTISYPKNRINVMLLGDIHQNAINILNAEGYTVDQIISSLNERELTERINNISILGIRSKTQVTNDVLNNAKRLMAVGAFCIGVEQINLEACSKKGISVFNAPYSNTRSVVELAVGEIIMLSRDIFNKSNKLRKGVWDKSVNKNCEIRGKKLGIVGYGNIGSQLSVLAESLGIEVYFYDVVEKLALGNARKCKSLRELLKKVDIVTLHVDGNPRNRKMISEKEFRLMKDGVIFLNLSRGFVVDNNSLVKYIKNGKIAGAAIDVFTDEPINNSVKFTSELQNFPNVIITPHIGGNTEEAQENIAEYVSKKIIEYVNTGNSFDSVNFPNIQLPKQQRAHRLIHIHDNIPGVLAQINSVLAKQNINIVGQYLKTNNEIGYVITDISKQYKREVIEELKKIPATIKFRVLY
jgi:D-3-phosphoglycerate dehydrogenase